jgi:ribosomal protein S18 acetylase RimI-like enzyme
VIPLGRRRWRRPGEDELERLVELLADWPSPSGRGVRHMFALAAMETVGAGAVRVTGDLEDVDATGRAPGAVMVRVSRDVLTVCGDPEAVRRAVGVVPPWRLLVGDRAACDALLATSLRPGRIVHAQRFLTVEPAAVPDVTAVGDPGRRRAQPEDLEGLAELAVRLHIDDGFGPDPGLTGLRGYRARLAMSVRAGVVDCVGPLGAPVAKLERSVSSPRWGVQLAGIVVDPAHRGSGIASGLVASAVREVLSRRPVPISLHTREDNASALHAYGVAGFRDREPWRLAVRP